MHLFETLDTSSMIAFLLEITLKGTLVLAAAGLAASLLKSASAAVRHLIWSTTLVLLLVLPVFVAFTPSYDLPVLPSELSQFPVERALSLQTEPSRAVEPVAPVPHITRPDAVAGAAALENALTRSGSVRVERNPTPALRSADLPASTRGFAWDQALFALWIIGASLVATRYFFGWLALRRMERRTIPVADVGLRLLVKRTGAGLGLRRRIRVVWGRQGSMPLTFGWVRPTVLLPEDAREWAPERLILVIQHELAHVKRCDCLVQAIVYIACTLYWFNPLVWLAARSESPGTRNGL